MATGIIYVLHGRRNKLPKANIQLLRDFIEITETPACIGFLEGKQLTLEDGLRQLQEQVDHIIIAPVLLFAATHVKQDIPRRVLATVSPDVSLTFLKPLATTNAVYDFLRDQISNALAENPERPVLLIAHGTPHYNEPYTQLKTIAEHLEDDLGVTVRCANYIGHHLIQNVVKSDSKPLIVQRLFLTDGRLANRIRDRVTAIQPDSIFLPTLEDHQVITQALQERLNAVNQVSSN